MKPTSFPLVLILSGSLLAACTLPLSPSAAQEQPSAVRAWFDAPLPNTVFYPPNPCQIVGHGSSPKGIASFELLINGVASTLPSPDTRSSLVTLTQECGVSQPGEYLLQLRARDGDGNWSAYAETVLILASQMTETAEPTAVEITATATATLTETATPSPTATGTPTGGITVERVSTNLVYLGRSGCGPLDVTIVVRAAAPAGIKVVVLFYRFQTASSSTEFKSVSMDPMGGDLFERTLNPTSLLNGSVPFENATLQYQVVIQQSNGDTSLRTPVLSDIAVQACGAVTASCSSYADERACVANGCSWVPGPGIVPVYECRAP